MLRIDQKDNQERNQAFIVISNTWLKLITSRAAQETIQNALDVLNEELIAQNGNSSYKIAGINHFLEKKLSTTLRSHYPQRAELICGLLLNITKHIHFGPRSLIVDEDNYRGVVEKHINAKLPPTSALITVGKKALAGHESHELSVNIDQLNLLTILNNKIARYKSDNKKYIKQEFIARLQHLEIKVRQGTYARFDDELDRAIDLLSYREDHYYKDRSRFSFFTSAQKNSTMQPIINQIRHKVVELRQEHTIDNPPPRRNRS